MISSDPASIRHHDDHRLGESFLDKVVKDLGCASH